MHARVTTVNIAKDKINDATKLYKDSIVPAISGQKGFQGYYLLTDHNTGEGISITLWDSEADGHAYESSGLYKEQVDKLRPMFSSAPALKSFTVGTHALATAKMRG